MKTIPFLACVLLVACQPGTVINTATPPAAEADATYISWDEAGCPNRSWPAHVDFVFWTNATISVYQGVDPDVLGDLIGSQGYTCITTRDPATATCTRVP